MTANQVVEQLRKMGTDKQIREALDEIERNSKKDAVQPAPQQSSRQE